MIVFHEGLPGSGKSYESCVYHILPAIAQGRRVVTNIEGINNEKIAKLSGVPVAVVNMLIDCVYHEEEPDPEKRTKLQRDSILEKSGKDALIVIDEIQNLFPSGRDKLSPDWMRYISEHRHDGLDIILMGQDRRDCHNMWRRRIQRVISFTKQTALGRDSHYTWVAYEATRPETYKKITSGGRSYEKQYFGMYKSHTDGTDNKGVYSDKRINIFKTSGFKYGLPAVVIVGFFAINHLINFFSPPEPSELKSTPANPSYVVVDRQPESSAQAPAAAVPVEPVEPEFEPIDLFDEMANKYRPRLAAVIASEETEKVVAYVHLVDSSYHVQDIYTIDALVDMGWDYDYRDSGLVLTKGDRRYLVRPWPIDRFGQVDKHTRSNL